MKMVNCHVWTYDAGEQVALFGYSLGFLEGL
jgi:hypothetical protein